METATTAAGPLALGRLTVSPAVVLAPMAGVTNLAYRRVCRDFGAGLTVSEMVSARAVLQRDRKTLALLAFAPDEPLRSVQLFAVDPRVVAEAVRILRDEHDVEHVDLNFGCPADKVTRRGAGSALPAHPVLFRSIVDAAVRAAGPVPVTVKLRIGLSDAHHTVWRAAREAEEAGVAAITLHARTAEQRYSGDADWTAIARLKEQVTSVPVLGNGDLWEGADAVAMIERTGCDGVVVGRGCLGRPWLFRDLADALAGRPVAAHPALGAVADVLWRHALGLADLQGEDHGVRDLRKHMAWYLAGFPVGGDVRRALARVSSLAEVRSILDGLDGDLRAVEGAARIRRGHTDGPRPISVPEGWLDPAALDDPTPPAGADTLAVSGG